MLPWICRRKDGFLQVRMICRRPEASPERFLNLCMANRIVLWDICRENGEYRFFVSLKDFKRVRPSARKARVCLRVQRKRGLPFFIRRNRVRSAYGVGILCFFLILSVMSRFVWHISIDGNVQYSDDTMLHFLNEAGVRYGTPTGSVNLPALEEAIRSEFEDVIWVSAHISGTRLAIRIKENDGVDLTDTPDSDRSFNLPGNLVADRSGVITRMIVRSGKAAVSVGDTVESGQILVSGELPIENDDGETDHIRYAAADADIVIRTEETCCDEIPGLVT
ncbi:MAG: sporulation protein YqfD, partial [Clostridiales bacterium]|nr:sporulation protein YqfD [Clostridiales bacterium]